MERRDMAMFLFQILVDAFRQNKILRSGLFNQFETPTEEPKDRK